MHRAQLDYNLHNASYRVEHAKCSWWSNRFTFSYQNTGLLDYSYALEKETVGHGQEGQGKGLW